MGCVRAIVEILRWLKRGRGIDVGIGHPDVVLKVSDRG